MIKQLVYFVLLILINNIQIIISTKSDADYYRYLQQFGYTPKVEGRRLFSVTSKSTYNEGIKTFQRLYKLPETGELDEKTKNFMQRPRCGNPDLGTVHSIGRPVNVDAPSHSSLTQGRAVKMITPESYVTKNLTWPKKHLKWFIESYPTLQKEITSHDQIRRIMTQAFHDWEKYSGLKFEMVQTKQEANLKLSFNLKDHGDGYPFDGQGTTLAHAFFPESGEIHFDDDERFTDSYNSKDEEYTLRLVAAHEIGHALGLSHSFESDSLMFPVYQQFNSDYEISHDDQQGIQSLYGKPSDTTHVSSTKPTSIHTSDILPQNNWCSGDFHTGCEGPDGELYLFKDNQVWRYRVRKRSWDPQPKLISEMFSPAVNITITACVKSATGYTHLFRNYRMWKLKTHWSMDGPFMLHGRHYPQNPRVALLHQNSIYLIRHRLIYRLNEFDYDRQLDIHTIDTILNPPPNEHIRSGFTFAKRHYIFTKNHVYVYDSTHGNLLSGYPKSRTNGWFACDAAAQKASKGNKKPATTTTTTTTAYREEDNHRHQTKEPSHHRHPPPRRHDHDDDYHHHHHHRKHEHHHDHHDHHEKI